MGREQMNHLTYKQALALLPAGAKWSSTFGCPIDDGYSEWYRTLQGDRFEIMCADHYRYHGYGWTFTRKP
jgi:hypothetical protein